MVTNSDLEKWQTATNGINELGQKDLTGEEWSALVTLNGSLQNGNFESDESRRAFALLKNNLSRHSSNQILQTHLQNFIGLCEQYSPNKSETAQPQVPPPPPVVQPISQSATLPTTFAGIPSEEIANWQKAVQGVEAGQNNLSSEELSAFNSLKEFANNGNFRSSESSGNIQILKNALPRHSAHRLLQMHLKNFIGLCEKYFQTNRQTISPKTRQSSVTTKDTNKTKGGSNKVLIFIIAALVIGFLVYAHWDSVKDMVGMKSTESDTALVNAKVDNEIDATTDLGVIINGVKWATRNVDKPGTFASTPESAGMLYQWNRKIGWSADDPMINSNGDSTWNSSNPTGMIWESANDPSPLGWHVPTEDEIITLYDNDKVTSKWITQNGVYGRKFIDKTTGNSLFLTAVGTRSGYESGRFSGSGIIGFYWSNTANDETAADNACFIECGDDVNEGGLNAWGNRSDGYSVRSVANAGTVKTSNTIRSTVDRSQNQSIEQTTVNSTTYTDANNLSSALSTRLLTEDDLRGMSKSELRILRNEIYARHGYIFKSQDLRDYFSAKDWYHPQYNDVSSLLNTIEKKNVAFIQRYE